MRRLRTHKWLPLLLALMLGSLPVAQALAQGELFGFDVDEARYSGTMAHSGHMAMSMDQGTCESCDTADHPCDGGQCKTCTAMILQEPLVLGFVRYTALIPATEASSLVHRPYLLFRPPRA